MKGFTDDYESIVLSNLKTHNESAKNHLILFFVTGNPGLVSYYDSYLAILHDLSSQNLNKSDGLVTHVYSCSLAGFETFGATNPMFKQVHGSPPYTLDQQIDYIDGAVDDAITEVERQSTDAVIKVVLIGHSVGAYMSLEVISRRQAQARDGFPGRPVYNNIIGYVGLTPTVLDLAQSPQGKRVQYLASKPTFAPFVAAFAKCLLFLLPSSVLIWLVKTITGFPNPGASVTASFLKSRDGVLQSLFLARCELAQMTVDKWDDELWGVTTASNARTDRAKTRLFFLFAEKDHWVADETRDRLVNTRAGNGQSGVENKPVMEIDHDGMPHAFCIRHSEPVAEKTVEYLQQIIDAEWR